MNSRAITKKSRSSAKNKRVVPNERLKYNDSVRKVTKSSKKINVAHSSAPTSRSKPKAKRAIDETQLRRSERVRRVNPKFEEQKGDTENIPPSRKPIKKTYTYKFIKPKRKLGNDEENEIKRKRLTTEQLQLAKWILFDVNQRLGSVGWRP